MSWQTIAASETDANSPLNQTLLDKIRGNLEYLHAAGSQLKFVKGSFSNNSAIADFTLDNTLDWRDRYLQAVGNVTIHNLTSNYLPGGADDDELGSRYTTINGVGIVGHFDQWMYPSSGGANKTTNPYLYTDWDTAGEKAWIWVDSATGNLKLSISTSRGSGYRNVTYNLRLVYSEDQGGH